MSKPFQISSLILVLCIMCACRVEEVQKDQISSRRALIVEWSDGVALYSVTYKVDGRIIGRGKDAYHRVIEIVRSLPDESILVVRRPVDIAGLLLDATGSDSPFPFEGHRAEELDFQNLMTRKRFSISAETFVQVEFVNE